MTVIANPTSLAEHLVNAVIADLYGRRGGRQWFDSIDPDVLTEVALELTAVVQGVLDHAGVTP